MDSVIVEQRHLERIVSGLRVGESAVVNGRQVTVVGLEAAELLRMYSEAARVMAACRLRLAAAGLSHLVGGDV